MLPELVRVLSVARSQLLLCKLLIVLEFNLSELLPCNDSDRTALLHLGLSLGRIELILERKVVLALPPVVLHSS